MSAVAPADARLPLVLVLDLGSSSLRATLYDALARPVAGREVRDAHPLHTTPDGRVEEDAVETTERVAAAIDRLLALAGDQADGIGAVGMACYAATLVGVDPSCAPLTPVYLYADTRPTAEVRALRARVDEDAVQQRTGCRLHTSYLPARLRWLARVMPEVSARVHRWLSLPEFLYARFLGAVRASFSIASWSGLLNRHTLTWDEEWLRLLGLDPAALSPLGDEPLTGLLPAYAARWPALTRAPWFPAVADGAASNIGSGCLTPAEAALAIGTSGALRVVTPSPPTTLPSGLWCYRVDRRRALLGGALNEAGGVVAWARALLNLGDFEQAEAAAGRAAPDGHGLTVLPFLAGERSPGWNPDIRAAVVGMDLHTSPVDVLQALMEAVAYRFALVWRELVQVAPAVGTVIASGGGAVQSPVWVRMIADVLGRPVTLSAEAEATSRGVAVLALEALGAGAAIPPAETAAVFRPDPHRQAHYAAAIARQERLYRLLADWHSGE